ncbi:MULTISPECIES: cyanophycinase [Polyangium]|uniref:Cyanophycinase n=2 Tax=Polyangium TaxID=55 RepID=A0A4U1JC30_9BACT|nr:MULTISPECIES: cyanophycinase [Polyangium]MDI1431084.1 cyanophycinase [Polyangium sorediatum]TKD07841.1 cyanophycinase [Polyangium fumosum]
MAHDKPEASAPDAHGKDGHLQRGPLIAIGGAEDKVGARNVLREVVRHAGGPKQARIAVFPTASSIPTELAGTYEAIFRELGADVHVVRIESRSDGEDPRILALVKEMTAVFFTGGDQGRIVTMLGGTELARTIRRAHRSGCVVAGTSAGASVLCDHMIAQGKKGYAPRRELVMLAPGLGLTRKLVIDQHFAQRHRIGRLFSAVAMNPFLIGVGIDEDTAIVLRSDKKMDVIGRGTVTIIDGSKIQHTDIHEVPRNSSAALLGLSVHVLTQGCGYDIDGRQPSWPSRSKEAT